MNMNNGVTKRGDVPRVVNPAVFFSPTDLMEQLVSLKPTSDDTGSSPQLLPKKPQTCQNAALLFPLLQGSTSQLNTVTSLKNGVLLQKY